MKRRVLSIFLSLLLVGSLLAGCNTNKKEEATSAGAGNKGDVLSYNGVDISKAETITLYLLGEKSKDFDKVYAEINKILKEKLNATVDVKFLSWSEHDTKYSLLFSAREDFDLIFTASGWGHYEQTVTMGGFEALTQDFIQKYAPGIWETVPEIAWSQATIDGNIYMVPNYQNEFGADVVAIRGDLMEKYNYAQISSWDELVAFYNDVAANERESTPLGVQGGALQYPYLLDKGVAKVGGSPSELFLYNMVDPDDFSINYALDWDGFTQYCKAVKDMYDKGFWSADSLATTEERQDGFLKGTAASMFWNLGSVKRFVDQANKEQPEWKATLYDISPNVPKKVNSYINNGVAINGISKKKERAMMVLNEFYTNKEIFDLAMLGIEGVHWRAVGEDEYTLLDGNADYGVDSNCNWGWTNANLKRIESIENPTAVDAQHQAILDAWNANIKPGHIYDGFVFNSADVSAEMAAVETVVSQYFTPLVYGMAGDVDAAMLVLREQLNRAGIENIYNEIKKQAEEYKASRGK
jgi:putative aldouronate transport system substrate-binding protein